MAVNPLLLTMIATVHLYYGKLPGARITLYKAICDVFLSRRTEVPNSSQELRAEQRQLVLQSLAYHLMQKGWREISREDACRILATPLQLVSSTQTPQDFLDHLEAITSGLLLEREQGVYSFAHQTFQEYLAMIYIQENHLEQELLSHINASWWHETILLFCAQADATIILQACITQSLPSLEALTLAIDCVEEARTVKVEVKERLYLLLEQGINDVEPERRKVIAEALLKRRLLQMLPLQGAIFVDTSLITSAEYQLFLDEQRTHGHNAAPDIWSNGAFPQGHGGDSLRGVRKEDAKAFCQWLTERDREGQSYRLPRREEHQQLQRVLGARLTVDVSYWEENGSVVWSHGGPSRFLQEIVLKDLMDRITQERNIAFTRTSTHERDLASFRDLDRASSLASALDLALEGDRALALDRALASTLDRVLANTSDLTIVSTLDRALERDRVLDLVLASTLDLASIRDLVFERDFALALALANDLALALALASDRALKCTHALKRTHASDLEGDLEGDLALARALKLASTLALARASDFDLDLALKRTHALASDLDFEGDLGLASASDLASDLGLTLAFTSTLERELANASALALEGDRTRALERALGLTLAYASALKRYLTYYLANTFKIYIYIFLFVQRPKGMLPAYEGILLIKERTTEIPSTSRN